MTWLNRRSFITGLSGFGLVSIPSVRATLAASKISPDDKSVLIVVDVQNCFLPGGSLAVTDGDQVIPVINRIAKAFSNVVLTQDWHTPGTFHLRPRIPAPSHLKRLSSHMVSRSCGQIIAFKGRVQQRFRRTFSFRRPS